MFKVREIEKTQHDIWRVFISGSSGSGKTYFAEHLLKRKFFKFERIYYYHPDLQESFPTNWKNNFNEPVLYQAGLPTEDELLSMPQYSCVVFDDLFTRACESRLIDYLFRVLSSKRKIHCIIMTQRYFAEPVLYQAGLPTEDELLSMPQYSCVVFDDLFTRVCESRLIDYLFRVLSSKRKLHCIIMTQRYFAEGSNGLNIRNSSNFHVLMNNADERTNLRVADSMNLRKEVNLALKENKTELYPYLFIDRTNHARVTGLQIYTDIFSRYQKAIHKLMLVYLVSESDFKSNFNLLDNHTAVRHENKVERISTPGNSSSESKANTKFTADLSKTERKHKSRFQQRKQFTRQVERIIHRYHLKTKL